MAQNRLVICTIKYFYHIGVMVRDKTNVIRMQYVRTSICNRLCWVFENVTKTIIEMEMCSEFEAKVGKVVNRALFYGHWQSEQGIILWT